MSNILPPMARLGRNSQLTNKLVVILKSKLEPGELRQFEQWLHVVEDDKRLEVQAAKRKAGLRF